MTPSITLTLMSELLGGQTTQEARPAVGEGQTPTPTPAVPPAPASEPQTPKRWRTLRTPDGQRPSPRQAQRDARQYAEAWYRAVRDWERRTNGGMLVIGGGGKHGSKRQMTPVVGNWGGAPYGVHHYAEISTPMGWVSEAAIAHRCNMDPLLGRLRAGGGLGSLIHGSGTGWNGQEAQAYAVAVLALAVSLGDTRAIDHLNLLKLRD